MCLPYCHGIWPRLGGQNIRGVKTGTHSSQLAPRQPPGGRGGPSQLLHKLMNLRGFEYESVVGRVNEGMVGRRVTKSQELSWG